MRITPVEKYSIIEKKIDNEKLSFRSISGYLREVNIWVSNSTAYRVLKEKGMVGPYMWQDPIGKDPKYEPYRPNMLWGEDWTAIWIDRSYWNLLTVIDYFSRMIIKWDIVQYVTKESVQKILYQSYKLQNIKELEMKPIIRFDQHKSNISWETLEFLYKLELDISPSRAHRPTDNPRMERFYRTIKTDDIKIRYDDYNQAKDVIAKYIDHYNNKRPHQSLWGYTPAYVHKIGNKSCIYDHYRSKIVKARKNRLDYWKS